MRDGRADVVDWLLRAVVWVSGGVLVFAVLVLVRDEIALDLHNAPATATIREVNNGTRGPGSVRVAFTTGGRSYETWIEQTWFGPHYRDGQPVAIEYDPGDPTRARLAGVHDLISLVVVVAGVAVAGLVVMLLRRGPRAHGPSRHGG